MGKVSQVTKERKETHQHFPASTGVKIEKQQAFLLLLFQKIPIFLLVITSLGLWLNSCSVLIYATQLCTSEGKIGYFVEGLAKLFNNIIKDGYITAQFTGVWSKRYISYSLKSRKYSGSSSPCV